jgi:metal-responsive CopG/Arc/MetJ family transcriptional regulator
MKHYTFNLDEQDIEIIDGAADKMTKPNRSEAIRKIIREWHYWAELRRQQETRIKLPKEWKDK